MSNQVNSNENFILNKSPEELLEIYKSLNINIEDLVISLIWLELIMQDFAVLPLAIIKDKGEKELESIILQSIEKVGHIELICLKRNASIGRTEEFLKSRTLTRKISILKYINQSSLTQEEKEKVEKILKIEIVKNLFDLAYSMECKNIEQLFEKIDEMKQSELKNNTLTLS